MYSKNAVSFKYELESPDISFLRLCAPTRLGPFVALRPPCVLALTESCCSAACTMGLAGSDPSLSRDLEAKGLTVTGQKSRGQCFQGGEKVQFNTGGYSCMRLCQFLAGNPPSALRIPLTCLLPTFSNIPHKLVLPSFLTSLPLPLTCSAPTTAAVLGTRRAHSLILTPRAFLQVFPLPGMLVPYLLPIKKSD